MCTYLVVENWVFRLCGNRRIGARHEKTGRHRFRIVKGSRGFPRKKRTQYRAATFFENRMHCKYFPACLLFANRVRNLGDFGGFRRIEEKRKYRTRVADLWEIHHNRTIGSVAFMVVFQK